MVDEIEALSRVIHELHGVEATHRESVPVEEVWRGQTVWDGVVEVFDLKGHPKAHRAYAWSYLTDNPKHPTRHVTVLHVSPVLSMRTAVQAAIMQEYHASQA